MSEKDISLVARCGWCGMKDHCNCPLVKRQEYEGNKLRQVIYMSETECVRYQQETFGKVL